MLPAARHRRHPDRIGALYAGSRTPTSRDVAARIVTAADARKGGIFLYVEVAEEDNPRRSFDINLYKAGLVLADVRDLLAEAARHFSVPHDRLAALYSGIAERPLGHLSGGLDRQGREFLAVYYEIGAL